jgi:hypothetical protein
MTFIRSYPEFAICVGSLLLCAAGFAFLGHGGWPGALHECVATSTCYCESKQAGWIAQPANTWSGLAFIAVGLAVAWHAGRARTSERPMPDNPVASSHLYPGLLALSICLLGLSTLGPTGSARALGCARSTRKRARRRDLHSVPPLVAAPGPCGSSHLPRTPGSRRLPLSPIGDGNMPVAPPGCHNRHTRTSCQNPA